MTQMEKKFSISNSSVDPTLASHVDASCRYDIGAASACHPKKESASYDDSTIDSTFGPIVRWYKRLSRPQKALYMLGTLTLIIMMVALLLVGNDTPRRTVGSSTATTSSEDLIGATQKPVSSPTIEPSIDPSGVIPLKISTDTPTSNPHPVPETPLPSLPAKEGTDETSITQSPSSVVTSPSVVSPTATPNASPTSRPTVSPTASPTISPTRSPTKSPTRSPTKSPTTTPPTSPPTAPPTGSPVVMTLHPTETPSSSPPTYMPGNLTTIISDLLLSEGLNARIIARTDEKVEYDNGRQSKHKFHDQPDAGATFPDNNPDNPGGWIYVSNAEVDGNKGGVGAITFDADGNVLDYQMVLKGTSMNCGGGRTPWNTWVSCEEVEFHGLIYQVDPTGQRDAEVMTLGSNGGRWESFAYDIRNPNIPRYFATEDHNKGTVRRFTPDAPDWDSPWDMLHGPGTTDYLMITPNATNDGGTFAWVDDFEAAKNNARSFYPQTEGIDVYGSQLFYVCKRIKQLFVLNLDDGTYYNHTTTHGLFDGTPDQMQRVLGDTRGLLYFTEEGGRDAGK